MDIKKFLIFQIIIVMCMSVIPSIFQNKVMAYNVTHNQTKSTGIDAFPDTYKDALRSLQETHSNWTFTAYNTGMSWDEFVNGETGTHLRNRVHNSSDASWKCTCNQSSGGYACASSGAFQYFADPRNFLTEERNIPVYGDVL